MLVLYIKFYLILSKSGAIFSFLSLTYYINWGFMIFIFYVSYNLSSIKFSEPLISKLWWSEEDSGLSLDISCLTGRFLNIYFLFGLTKFNILPRVYILLLVFISPFSSISFYYFLFSSIWANLSFFISRHLFF